jgi:hypothetical protein
VDANENFIYLEGTCGQHRPTKCKITNRKACVDSIGPRSARSQTGRHVWTASAHEVQDHKPEGTCGQHGPLSARSQTGRDVWTASAYRVHDHKQEGTCGQHRPTECTITNRKRHVDSIGPRTARSSRKGRLNSIGPLSARSQTERDVWTASAHKPCTSLSFPTHISLLHFVGNPVWTFRQVSDGIFRVCLSQGSQTWGDWFMPHNASDGVTSFTIKGIHVALGR